MPTLFKGLPTRLSFVLWLGNLSCSLPLGFHFVRVASYQEEHRLPVILYRLLHETPHFILVLSSSSE